MAFRFLRTAEEAEAEAEVERRLASTWRFAVRLASRERLPPKSTNCWRGLVQVLLLALYDFPSESTITVPRDLPSPSAARSDSLGRVKTDGELVRRMGLEDLSFLSLCVIEECVDIGGVEPAEEVEELDEDEEGVEGAVDRSLWVMERWVEGDWWKGEDLSRWVTDLCVTAWTGRGVTAGRAKEGTDETEET